MEASNNFKNYLSLLTEIFQNSDVNKLDNLYKSLDKKFSDGGNIFIAGNGGSAAISSHAATDLNKLSRGNETLNAICLTSNISAITAYANDAGYENVLVNLIKNYNPSTEDVLITISSSGNSENIINLVNYSKKCGIQVFSLLGFDGGLVKDIVEDHIIFSTPKSYYGPVEDLHMMVFHLYAHIIKNDISELK